ncbi:hypothetical protein CIW49_13665 [Mycolicibacterium sp. P1-18]|nr:hypothetical protein CIW49_13665 [Mycolicibacterium sp. P1-18]
MRGAIGPLAIADGIVKAEQEKESLPGEAHFLLAELALTVAAVDWEHVATEIPYGPVRALIIETVREIRNRLNALPPASDPALNVYVRDALAKAAR